MAAVTAAKAAPGKLALERFHPFFLSISQHLAFLLAKNRV